MSKALINIEQDDAHGGWDTVRNQHMHSEEAHERFKEETEEQDESEGG